MTSPHRGKAREPSPESGRSAARPILDTGRHLVKRLQKLAWVGLLAGVVLIIPVVMDRSFNWDLGQRLALAILVISAFAMYHLLLRHVRSSAEREEALAEAARLDGATLATHTVQHHIGNRLAVAVGWSEMLADDPRLPAELHEEANRILTSAMEAANVTQRLGRDLVRVKVDTSSAGPPLLDLDASTSSPENSE
jgi:hypothetical protein